MQYNTCYDYVSDPLQAAALAYICVYMYMQAPLKLWYSILHTVKTGVLTLHQGVNFVVLLHHQSAPAILQCLYSTSGVLTQHRRRCL